MQEGLLPGVGLDHGDGDPNPGDLGPLRSAQASYDAVVSERPPLCPVSPPLCRRLCVLLAVRPLPVADRLSPCF